MCAGTRIADFFTFEYNERGHQTYRVLKVDAPTGNVSVVIEEKSKTFIDYSSKRFRYDLMDGSQTLLGFRAERVESSVPV